MDFAVLPDRRVKLKENEKKDRELKNVEHKSDDKISNKIANVGYAVTETKLSIT